MYCCKAETNGYKIRHQIYEPEYLVTSWYLHDLVVNGSSRLKTKPFI